MAVTKEVTPLEHSSLKLTVTVDKEDVRSQYDALVSDYRKSLRIPGFRPGKAPRDVLERKLGDALKGEALGRIIEKSIADIFEDEDFPKENRPLPYSSPLLSDEPSLNLDTDLVFSITYDVFPKITLGTWKGLELEIPQVSLTEEDLNRELDVIRERNAIVFDKDDDAPALKNDVVTVNYSELSDTGEPLPETAREDFVFTLGSGYNLFKFDDEILGMKKGETRDIEKTYPDDFDNDELAGKHKKIRVTLTALKEKKLPDLDDDLAQDVDEKFETLEDLKTNVRERLTWNMEKWLRGIKVNKLLEKIMETTPVDLPESMIRLELDSRWRNLARRYNIPPEELEKRMARSGQSNETIRDGWRPEVVKALHSRLIVDTLGENLGITVSDEEVEKEYETIAAETNASMEDIKKYYTQENMLEYLKEEIKDQKLYDYLFKENKFTPGPEKHYLDLVSNNG
ncbi:trigger factor [Treponema sp. TIM-1]|uniref:trigger factor n=1 Tax=Treponema sp. TIM-1 TaxID=2898417 RepID=UPI003980A85A